MWIGKRIDPHTLAPRVPQSTRGRIQAINYLNRSLLQSKEQDRDEIIRVWTAAMEGAQAIRSEGVYRKAMTNFEIMRAFWPSERAIMKLLPMTAHW
jgi:hypothetical protein